MKVLKERPVTLAYHVSNAFYNISYGSVIPWNDYTVCPTSGRPNHAVLAVGYYVNPNNANDIWINVKNSWGTGWGTDGYFKLGLNNSLSSYGHGTCNLLQYYDEIAWATLP